MCAPDWICITAFSCSTIAIAYIGIELRHWQTSTVLLASILGGLGFATSSGNSPCSSCSRRSRTFVRLLS
jgi:hypothetical protein